MMVASLELSEEDAEFFRKIEKMQLRLSLELERITSIKNHRINEYIMDLKVPGVRDVLYVDTLCKKGGVLVFHGDELMIDDEPEEGDLMH